MLARETVMALRCTAARGLVKRCRRRSARPIRRHSREMHALAVVIPGKAGIHWGFAPRPLERIGARDDPLTGKPRWIPAFAGMTTGEGRRHSLLASSRRTPGSRGAAYAPKRGARCASPCAPQTAFRPACGRPSKGGFECPKPPLHPPKGTPGSRRAHFLCARSPGKDARARAAKQLGHPCPQTVWLFPSRGRLFPATSRGPGALTRHPWLVGAATSR